MSSAAADTSSAPTILGVGISLQLITIFLVGARITTRLRSGKPLQWHDWAILLAEVPSSPLPVLSSLTLQVLSISQLIFVIDATLHGYGRHQQFVAPSNVTAATRSIFMAQVIFFWSVTLVKISVVCLLMSLKRTSRRWNIFFFITLSILLISLIPITATQFLGCQPFAAYWDAQVRLEAVCWPPQAIFGNVVAFSVVQALTDVVFSFIPLTFLIPLHQPLRERVTISILMALGLFASATAIARTVISVIPRPDMFKAEADTTLLALLDFHVGVIAATLPTLKVFFQSYFVGWINSTKNEQSEQDVRAALCELGLLSKAYYPKVRKSSNGDVEVG